MSWREVRIGDLGRVVTGKTPPTNSREFYDGLFPFVTPSDIGYSNYYCNATEQTVSDLAKDRLKNQFIPLDSVMVTCIGNTIGKTAIAAEECLTNQQINSIVVGENHDPKFVYYLMCNSVNQIRSVGLGGGAAQPIINKSTFSGLKVRVPERDQQLRTGQILAGYDDLIANNQRRIELLEQSARLLFKEWFVHLRYPGHEHDKIADGVPTGWTPSTIEAVCRDFIDGDWLETKDQGGDSFRILQISNIGENSFVETGHFRYITDETLRRLNCTEVVPGDILISRMPEPIGRAWLVTPQAWRMVTAVDVTIARPDLARVETFYFLHHLNSSVHLARCAARATGATRPRIAKRVMGALPILVPPKGLQTEFADFASANNELKTRLTRQCDVLSRARDLLLPRLLDGRISV